MKKEDISRKFDSISEAHQAFGLPKPRHPLISLIGSANIPAGGIQAPGGSHVLNFYKISYRPKLSGKLKYGQSYYDFDEGGLMFASPNQVIGGGKEEHQIEGCSMYA